MRFLLLIFLFSNQNSFAYLGQACNYKDKSSCPSGFYCVHQDKGKDICYKNFQKKLLKVEFPFSKNIKITCNQGYLTPDGNSHTWHNTAFALDLHTPRDKNVDKGILAGAPGQIISYSSCKTKNDSCGTGFGNHVKILTEDNFIILYAHLDKVYVKTGDRVKAGDRIGTEGMTGGTGKDNPHIHFSVHYDWKTKGVRYWSEVGYVPPSVPFKLNYCQANCDAKKCNSKFIDIRNLSCRRTNSNSRPICIK